MALLIAVLLFMILLVLVILCYNLTANGYTIKSRMERYIEEGSMVDNAPLAVTTNIHVKGWGLIQSISKYFESFRWSRSIENQLIRAGLPIRGSEFMVICLGVASFMAMMVGILGGSAVLVFIGGSTGLMLPLFVLRVKIKQRKKAFNDQLGDAITLIANSLRTGYSFMQAIELVSREMVKPIGEEFARVLKEMNLGVTTEEALNNMTRRVISEDLELVITAVLIQRQVGGNLAAILDSIANTIRARIKMKGQIKTLTAQGKISGLIIGLLPFVIGTGIYVINPEYMKVLFIDPMGRMMLAIGIVSQCIGIMIIRKIINIDI